MVYILLCDGFEESEAIVPADLLRRARIDTALVGVTGPTVTSSHSIRVAADLTLDRVDLAELELVFLPGGLKGVENLKASPAAMELVRAAAQKGALVTAICAAPTLLGGLGLLDGKAAVCYPGMEDGLGAAHAKPGTPVVVDGAFVTGEAAGSSFQFGLKLVELLRGAETMEAVKEAVHFHG